MTDKSVNWLTTLDLQQFIAIHGDKNTKAAFLGVFSIDDLPSKKVASLPLLFIVNTNPKNLPGEHWIAAYVSTERLGEVFDSLAMPVSIALEQWMNAVTRTWIVTPVILQNPFSPSCGAYVLYYVLMRLKHKSLKSCIARFTNDVVYNDKLVNQFYHQIKVKNSI